MNKFVETPDELVRLETQDLLKMIDEEGDTMLEEFEKQCPQEYAHFIAENQSLN